MLWAHSTNWMEHLSELPRLAIPLAVFASSLFGSLHCVGMCGGLASNCNESKTATLSYHLSRLASYLVLGAIAGSIGDVFLSSPSFSTLSYIATLLVGVALVWQGVSLFQGRLPHIPQPKWLQRFIGNRFQQAFRGKNPVVRSLFIGGFTGLLPCGWLHVYLLAALSTRSVLGGTLILLFFWLGTIPALLFGTQILKYLVGSKQGAARQVAGILIVCIGFATLAAKVRAIPHDLGGDSREVEECHH